MPQSNAIQDAARATEAQPAAQVPGDDAVIHRAGTLVPGSFNETDNTVDVVFSTGARGLRYDWRSDTVYEEELDISTQAVDMSRIDSGVCQVLDSHDSYSGVRAILGIARRGWISGGQALATLRLSSRAEVAGFVRDIADGIIRAISVGYRVEVWDRIMPEARTDGGKRILMRAVRWTPFEISFVPVPFDAGASTRSLPAQAGAARTLGLGMHDGLPLLDLAAADHIACQRQGVPAQRRDTAAAPASDAVTRALSEARGIPFSAGAQASAAAPAGSPANRSQEELTMPNQARTEGGEANPAAQTTTTAAPAAQAAAPAPAAQRAADAPDEAALRQAEAARSAGIMDLCARLGMPDMARQMVADGFTLERASQAVLARLAERDAAAGGHRNLNGNVRTVSDDGDMMARGLEEALMHRVDAGAQLTDNGRRFRGMSLLELGRVFLQRAGVPTEGLTRMELAARMLTTRTGMHASGDFATLLANVANKRLRMGYEENPGTYARWARRAPNAPDFKNISVAQLSAMPDLLQTNEHGEFKYGTLTDGGETYKVITYGRIVSLTRQAIINDDLRGFDRLVTGFASSSARLENRLVYAQLTANAAMADAVALFHATHANLGTGGGSALSFDALTAGRKAMRKQKGLQQEELNLAPSFLLVPSDLEQLAYQLTSSNYTPATQSNVNEFRTGGRTALEPIVEPILDGSSATAWYLAAQNSQVDTVEYCWLDGAEGPVMEQEMGFEVDGISIKCREDFAAKVIDFRGLYKGNGA